MVDPINELGHKVLGYVLAFTGGFIFCMIAFGL
jgi:hypothetical protein